MCIRDRPIYQTTSYLFDDVDHAAALFNLMEDAATAEISRSQLWQWFHKRTITNESIPIDKSYLETIISEEVQEINDSSRNLSMLNEAVELFSNLIFNDEFEDFLTIPAYKLID